MIAGDPQVHEDSDQHFSTEIIRRIHTRTSLQNIQPGIIYI